MSLGHRHSGGWPKMYGPLHGADRHERRGLTADGDRVRLCERENELSNLTRIGQRVCTRSEQALDYVDYSPPLELIGGDYSCGSTDSSRQQRETFNSADSRISSGPTDLRAGNFLLPPIAPRAMREQEARTRELRTAVGPVSPPPSRKGDFYRPNRQPNGSGRSGSPHSHTHKEHTSRNHNSWHDYEVETRGGNGLSDHDSREHNHNAVKTGYNSHNRGMMGEKTSPTSAPMFSRPGKPTESQHVRLSSSAFSANEEPGVRATVPNHTGTTNSTTSFIYTSPLSVGLRPKNSQNSECSKLLPIENQHMHEASTKSLLDRLKSPIARLQRDDEAGSVYSDVTSSTLSSLSRRKRCTNCRQPDNPINPLRRCLTCSRRYHAVCMLDMFSVRNSEDGVCRRCIKKQECGRVTSSDNGDIAPICIDLRHDDDGCQKPSQRSVEPSVEVQTAHRKIVKRQRSGGDLFIESKRLKTAACTPISHNVSISTGLANKQKGFNLHDIFKKPVIPDEFVREDCMSATQAEVHDESCIPETDKLELDAHTPERVAVAVSPSSEDSDTPLARIFDRPRHQTKPGMFSSAIIEDENSTHNQNKTMRNAPLPTQDALLHSSPSSVSAECSLPTTFTDAKQLSAYRCTADVERVVAADSDDEVKQVGAPPGVEGKTQEVSAQDLPPSARLRAESSPEAVNIQDEEVVMKSLETAVKSSTSRNESIKKVRESIDSVRCDDSRQPRRACKSCKDRRVRCLHDAAGNFVPQLCFEWLNEVKVSSYNKWRAAELMAIKNAAEIHKKSMFNKSLHTSESSGTQDEDSVGDSDRESELDTSESSSDDLGSDDKFKDQDNSENEPSDAEMESDAGSIEVDIPAGASDRTRFPRRTVHTLPEKAITPSKCTRQEGIGKMKHKGVVFETDSGDEADDDQEAASFIPCSDPLMSHKHFSLQLWPSRAVAEQYLQRVHPNQIPKIRITKGQGLKNAALITQRQHIRNLALHNNKFHSVSRPDSPATVIARVDREKAISLSGDSSPPISNLYSAKRCVTRIEDEEEKITFLNFLGIESPADMEPIVMKHNGHRKLQQISLAFREKTREGVEGGRARRRATQPRILPVTDSELLISKKP